VPVDFQLPPDIPIWPSPTKPHVASRCGVVENARAEPAELKLAGQRRLAPAVWRRATLGKEEVIRTLILQGRKSSKNEKDSLSVTECQGIKISKQQHAEEMPGGI
jgi:ribosomal protein S6